MDVKQDGGEAEEARLCPRDCHFPELPLTLPSPPQSIFPRLLPASPGESTDSPSHQPSAARITACHAARSATLPAVPRCRICWQVPRYHGNAVNVQITFSSIPISAAALFFPPLSTSLATLAQPASQGRWERVRTLLCSQVMKSFLRNNSIRSSVTTEVKLKISKQILINPPLSLLIRLNHREKPKRPETFLLSDRFLFFLKKISLCRGDSHGYSSLSVLVSLRALLPCSGLLEAPLPAHPLHSVPPSATLLSRGAAGQVTAACIMFAWTALPWGSSPPQCPAQVTWASRKPHRNITRGPRSLFTQVLFPGGHHPASP